MRHSEESDTREVLDRLREAQRRASSALVEPAPPTPTDPPTTHGRAGRDLTAAIGVGIGLALVLVASLLYDIRIFVGLVALVIGAGMWELARAVRLSNIRIPLEPLWVGGAGMMISAWVGGPSALLMAFALTCGAVFVWRVVEGGGLAAVRDASTAMFVAAYLPFLASFAVLLARRPDGAWAVLTFVAIVVASDTGGYIAGVLFGKHPMSPSISPKKSWEGFAGSITLATAIAIVCAHFALGLPWWTGVLLGVLGVLTGTVGDLAESLIKRDLGLKDMGTILPGHGGIMDRLDSLLVTVPVIYLVLEAVA